MKKSELKEYLTGLIEYYEKTYGFNTPSGYVQVMKSDINIIVEYGKYVAICDLYEKLF